MDFSFDYARTRVRLFFYRTWFKINKKKVKELFRKREENGILNIPVFIVSYNRLSYLQQMIVQLEKMGLNNIHIIDNASSYPPLLKYYETCQHKVHFMHENQGHMVFWREKEFEQYRRDFYIVTDPDLAMIEDCPLDIVDTMFFELREHPYVKKIGPSLVVDDISPDTEYGKSILSVEMPYYVHRLKGSSLYYAPIDTTFALYLPDSISKHINFFEAFRMGYPYQARHLPWYKSSESLTQEDIYYEEHKTNGWWNVLEGTVSKDMRKRDRIREFVKNSHKRS